MITAGISHKRSPKLIINSELGGGFKYFSMFTPKLGEMIQFEDMFQLGGSTTN